ncbi:MAG: nucleotide exchange factor GrpE [candidate division Zixibacteria bacterium]|nr:nucleotide exchange factor GrpE [candidate division Zixibacteria bacterium]MDD5426856.1 nucleotide exchange factor GrpE [candidate division Zixibacteria bacterium]
MADKKEVKIDIDVTGRDEAAEKKDADAKVEAEAANKQEIPDVQPESAAASGSEEVPAEPEKALSEEEKLKNRVAELEDRLLRSLADFDNYKKRTVRQFEDIIRSANDKLLIEILEIVDNFERALSHDHDKTDFKAFRKGTELIYNQIMGLLKKYDVEPVNAVGQPFDPGRHEAMMQVESDKYPEGVVAMEISKGYRQGNRILRYSKVAVSSGKKKTGEDKQTQN